MNDSDVNSEFILVSTLWRISFLASREHGGTETLDTEQARQLF
jgi:hypothetical protein